MIQKCREAKVFLLIALVCGLLLVFLIPPLNAADEAVHFANAYAISRGDLFPDNVDNVIVGHYLPRSIWNYSAVYPGALWGNRDAKYSYSKMVAESMNTGPIGEPYLRGEGQVFTGYLAAAGGMVIGTALGKAFADTDMNAQPYNQMIYGRLGNLIFYILITYLALCITPRFKRSMLLVASMPMGLFLASSLSYDALIIPVSYLFIAIVLYMVSTGEKPITKGEIVGILFCTFFLIGVKTAYAPLLLLLLAVPKRKYGSVRKMVFCIVAVVVTAVIGYIPVYINGRIGQNIPANPAISKMVQAQSEWINSHLGETIHAIFNSLKVQGEFYRESFWGKLGWLDTPFPVPMMVIGYFMLAVTAILEIMDWNPKEYGKFWKRLLPVVGVLISFVGMEYVMYLKHTPRPDVLNRIGTDYVEGVQGRYFIPLFLPLMIPFSNCLLYKLRNSKREKVRNHFTTIRKNMSFAAEGWAVMCGVYTVLIVLLRYWV